MTGLSSSNVRRGFLRFSSCQRCFKFVIFFSHRRSLIGSRSDLKTAKNASYRTFSLLEAKGTPITLNLGGGDAAGTGLFNLHFLGARRRQRSFCFPAVRSRRQRFGHNAHHRSADLAVCAFPARAPLMSGSRGCYLVVKLASNFRRRFLSSLPVLRASFIDWHQSAHAATLRLCGDVSGVFCNRAARAIGNRRGVRLGAAPRRSRSGRRRVGNR